MFNKINLKIVLRRHKKSFIIAVQKIVFPDRSTFNKSDYNQYSNFQKHQRFFNNISMPNKYYMQCYRIFCTGNISQCTSGHLFIRSPALGVDALREEPMTSEEKEYQKLFNELYQYEKQGVYMEMEGSPASPTQIVRRTYAAGKYGIYAGLCA